MNINITDEMINIYENDLENQGIKIAKFVAEKYCNFNEKELGFIDRFWQNTFNDEWIYLSKEIIVNDFGYKNSKDMMKDFYKNVLFCNFTINDDYKQVNKEYIDKFCLGNFTERKISGRGGNNKKYYIISGECYKNLLMLVKTDKGKEIRKYYIKIENLSKKTYTIIGLINKKINDIHLDNINKDFQEKLKIKDEQIKKEQEKNIRLSKFTEKHHELHKNEIIYIACNKALASENRFKLGGVKSESLLQGRLCTYNTGLPNDDPMYFAFLYKVNDYSSIEQKVKRLIPNFLDKLNSKKEMYNIYYKNLEELLLYICKNEDKDIDYIIENVKDFTDNTITNTFIPKCSENTEIFTNKSNKIIKINISLLSQTKIDDLIKDLINNYKSENKAEIIKWSDLIKYLEKYITKSNRNILRNSIKNLDCNINFK